MLAKIEDLLQRLENTNIRYCHWKSNWNLPETLDGMTDVDLLVHRGDARRFRALLRTLDFDPAIETGSQALAAVEHYHAKDEATDAIAHVHAYYRVVTGESLVKNYHLPLEDMLLTHTRREGDVIVPKAGAEVIVFVLRMLIKHTTLIELGLLMRDWASFRREVDWLMTPAARDQARSLLPVWLPQIDDALFLSAYECLRVPATTPQRIVLGLRVRRRLRRLARRHPVRARLTEFAKFAARTRYRLHGSKKKLTPGNGGLLVAFVGSEASGKSTVLDEIARWLGAHFTVSSIHAGKPPSTLVTLVPHLALPLARTLLPRQRFTRVDAEYRRSRTNSAEANYPLLFGVRAVMLAYERRALLSRAFAEAANGAIVLCDRYPSVVPGSLDGVQLAFHGPAAGDLRRSLSSLEAHIYDDIPPPDLVVHLTAPLAVTLQRNATRAKTEPEDYVRLRHTIAQDIDFGGVPTLRIETDRPVDTVLRDVKRAIWDAL